MIKGKLQRKYMKMLTRTRTNFFPFGLSAVSKFSIMTMFTFIMKNALNMFMIAWRVGKAS